MAKSVMISADGQLVDEDGMPLTGVISQAILEQAVSDGILALPSLEDGPHMAWTSGGSPPSTTLTPDPIDLVRILAVRNGVASHSGDTVATSVLGGTVTPAAGTIPAGSKIHLVAAGRVLMNVAGPQNWTVRVRLGTANFLSAAVSLAQDSALRAWTVTALLDVDETVVDGVAMLTVGQPTDVTDLIVRTEPVSIAVGNDLDAWSTLDLTVQHGSSSGLFVSSCLGAVYTVYPPQV